MELSDLFTPEQIQALAARIATGVEQVRVGDMSVTFASLSDAVPVLKQLAEVVTQPVESDAVADGTRSYACFSRE